MKSAAEAKPSSSRRKAAEAPRPLSNAEIARQLLSLAQLLGSKGENPFKIRAYRRAAETILTIPESLDDLVRREQDLTQYSGIGKGIASAIREIVLEQSLRQLETLRAEASPELVAINDYPRLDPKRVKQIFKKLKIGSVDELRAKLESGELGRIVGPRLEHHVRQALTDSREILLYDADEFAPGVQAFLRERCGAKRVEFAGDYRRRVEVISDLKLIVAAEDFSGLVKAFASYGGRSELLHEENNRAVFRHSSGITLTLEHAEDKSWGLAWILATGSEAHLEKLETRSANLQRLARESSALKTELSVYRKLGLAYIEPELREGHDEVERAAQSKLPTLVSIQDLRGDLHAHSTSSDGAHSIEAMVEAARAKGYSYLGITDHSQSLKIAGGVSEEALWKQIRAIDRLNEKLRGFRVLKSAEVDILPDGSLDYSDALLEELDYTMCSIHSKFSLPKDKQTERVLRAMDHPCFTILGHATGRLLLRRPGYELDMERIIEHARQRGCFFEINSSPDRLDLSAAHARLARDAGIKIAINTDAHSRAELDFIRCGVDQARRAGLRKTDVLNCLTLPELNRAIKRS